MMGKYLTQIFTNTPLTIAGLILFFISFVALLVWVYARPGADIQYQKMAMLAFDEKDFDHEH